MWIWIIYSTFQSNIQPTNNFKYTVFTLGTIWALNIVHAVILDLDRNVDNMPEVEIVFNESTNQPQLSLSIALD